MKVFRGGTGSRYVWRQIHLNKSRMLLFLTLLALAFMLFIINTYPYNTVGVILIPLSYALGAYTHRKKLLWESGERGDAEVISQLDALDDTHSRLSGMRIPPNRGDADHIILAPNGILVLEVKNISGVVECEGDEWRRHKIGVGGGRYDIKMGNPSRQAKRNAKTLKDLLLANQQEVFGGRAPHIWVHAAVVLPDETKIECKNPTVDVIKTSQVADYIRNAKTEATYTESQIHAMAEFLAKHCR